MHEIHQNLNASPTRVGQLQEETAKDPTLSALREVIMGGWPEKRSDCPAPLHAYWNYRDELTVADGLILKGTRIIIPKSLQPDVPQQLHYAHQGAEKCQLRAKGSVFWANINKDIDEMVKSCPPCQRHQKLKAKEPLLPHDVPQKAWHTLCSDLFFWNNTYYLLVMDYYSKFPVVKKLANTSHQQSLHTLSLSLKNMGSLANLLQTTAPNTNLLPSKSSAIIMVSGIIMVHAREASGECQSMVGIGKPASSAILVSDESAKYFLPTWFAGNTAEVKHPIQ